MMAVTWPRLAAACAVTAALALAGCGRGADSGATANPVAPGSPGTGNDRVVLQPSAPDGPPGGPSGVKGSAPHPGSSGGDMVPGTTGSGTLAGGQPPAPGTGLHGGLGTGESSGTPTGTMGAPGAPMAGDGSSNKTPDAAVGRR